MDIDQCIEVMKSLKEAYQRVSQLGHISSDKVFHLKHSVMELELIMVSIKRSMEDIEEKHIKH